MSNSFRSRRSLIIERLTVVLLAVFSIFVFASNGFAQITVKAGDMKDSRTTGSFFAGFDIELSVTGASLTGAKAMRVLLSTAIDETGRNIIKESQTSFEEINEDETEASVRVKMKNPSRSAMTIKEVTGNIEIFVPAKDPAATLTVTSLSKSIGISINSPVLKASGIEITIWNKEQYEARKKVEEEKLKKSKSEEGIGGALMGIFGGLMDSFSSMDENSIAFQIKDPESKIVRIEILDAKGESLGSGGMTIGDSKQQTRIIDLQEKLPPDAQVKIHILTAKSMIKAPFKLEKIALP
jgi:hypothetical protein